MKTLTSLGTPALLCASWLAAAGCGGASVVEHADPGVVTLEGALGNTRVRAGETGQVVARIRVAAHAVRHGVRPPINLALVVDTSGSMQGEPIADAREASLAIVDMLADGDRLSVVAFNSRVEVLLPSTEVDDNLEELRERIGRMQASGTTDMAGGMQTGLTELMSNFQQEGVNRMVLLGDGVPNDAGGITAMAQAAGERGVAITAMGLGLDYDESLMGQIAQLSGGTFHYVEESAQVAEVFRDEILRMQRVVGHGAVVTLQPGPGVHIDNVVGQSVAHGDGAVRVTLGDLTEGEARDLIVRATVSGRRAGATVELMDVVLSFDDAIAEAGALERRVFLGARATESDDELRAGRNAEVEHAAAQMQAAAVTVEAIRVARGGELDRARSMLQDAERRAQAYAQEAGDAEVAAQASSMRSLTGALPSITGGAAQPATPNRSAAGGAPSAAPEEADEAEAERSVRRTHDQAMGVLGF